MNNWYDSIFKLENGYWEMYKAGNDYYYIYENNGKCIDRTYKTVVLEDSACYMSFCLYGVVIITFNILLSEGERMKRYYIKYDVEE